jgi:hypothetical protein
MPAFITVYQVKDGKKRDVPAHWMEHPELKKGFRKTPLTKAAEANQSSEGADSASTSTTTSTASRGSNKP